MTQIHLNGVLDGKICMHHLMQKRHYFTFKDMLRYKRATAVKAANLKTYLSDQW